jgi:hypothetical protein
MDSITLPIVSSRLSRTNLQRAVIRQKRKARPAAFASGARLDRIWMRKQETSDNQTNLDLINAVEWMHARRGARFSPTDRATISKIANRTWGFDELVALHFRSLPSWLADALPSRRSAGYHAMLGAVLGAYRAGAVGMWISYSEAMAALDVGSESTWRRWSEEWERLGLVRAVQTWTEDPTGQRPRVYGRTLYVAGEVMTTAIASLEGALDRGALDRDARTDAISRRKCARAEAHERLAHHRNRRASHDTPELRPSALSKRPATTPLVLCDNRNALPSFVGGDTTPPTVGIEMSAKDASASCAKSSGESASDSRSTATMLEDLMGKLGLGRSRAARRLLADSDGISRQDSQKAQGQRAGIEANPVGHVANGRDSAHIPLHGPIADQLIAIFAQRRRTEH